MFAGQWPGRGLSCAREGTFLGCTRGDQSHVETLKIYKLGSNQNYYTFALILLIKIVLCGKFHRTKFIHYKCFHMKSRQRVCHTTSENPQPVFRLSNFASRHLPQDDFARGIGATHFLKRIMFERNTDLGFSVAVATGRGSTTGLSPSLSPTS